MFDRIFQHKIILADQVRMEAYKKAIHEVVKKGDVVADIGTGSGILAFFAVQAGAKKVYAVEQDEVIEEAKKLAKKNGLDKRIVFIKGRSDRVEVPEKVDVIISELIGFFGLEENLHRFKIDARKRFLKPGGRLIPSWLELFLVPVESEAILKDHIRVWSSNYYGCDFSPVRGSAVSQRYVTDCSGKTKSLAPPAMISRINFHEIEKVPAVSRGEFVINKNGVFHGLVGYFQAGLSPSVVLSTSPENPLTHWKQTFFPLKKGVMVKEGDEVGCKIIAIPYGGVLFWQWETGVSRKGYETARFSQNNLSLRKEELAIRKKDFKPSLTSEGEVCRRVFELCDGKRTTEDIAEILWKEYPKEFKDTKEVLEVVVGIVRGKTKIS